MATARLDSTCFSTTRFRRKSGAIGFGDRLVGVGYVDVLDEGLSAIYFFHDPREAKRSLGTLNILHLMEAARQRGRSHVYLGYYVNGCRSLEYKARFKPNEIFTGSTWEPFIV